ncbi:AMP-binding protein [Streptomyces sp. SPB162]|uniref:class I adenylate-forming enzyme family protein n=1 Tax=Streptomyces sp. SPB162 TaxID=2940560 RepID=UPI0024073D18|nr:AMP-binding protein [Streptomyces sp. SPB162]MDF9811455.1 acyl-CoA synthetase (AMP-forming)/AMP-acid ligase II [Streptomyces sp. SPB162]
METSAPTAANPLRRFMAVHEILDAAWASHPNAPAVRDAGGGWTYAELAARSQQYSAWLRLRGVGPGDRVLIHAAADRRVVALLYACSRVGATFVPLGVAVKGLPREGIIRDARPTLVLARGSDLPPDDGELLGAIHRDARGGRPAPSADWSEAAPLAPALLIYTSGSTAAPKGIVCPHDQVIFAASAIADRLRYQADDVIFCRLPLSFDYGLYQVFLAGLAAAELVLVSTEFDAGLLAAARQCGATVVPVVPSLATLLLQLGRRDRLSTRIRLFTNTGEEMPQVMIDGLRQRFPGAQVQLMFGISECKRVSIMEPDGDRSRPGAVGLPLTGTRVRVVDGSGTPVPVGDIGEFVVSGPHVMAGYWQAPALSDEVFRRDAETGEVRLHTGDYGWLDSEGYLYFHGRRDDIFKLKGTRTSAQEIEAAARQVSGVSDAAVVPPGQQRDAVLCVVASISPTDVLRGVRDRLEVNKVPGICRVVEALPRGLTGKIDRTALHALVEG